MPRQTHSLLRSIMLVEEQSDLLKSVDLFLTSRGYRVVTTDSPTSALERLTRERFDLLIMDMSRLGRDRIDLAHEIRESGSDIPIVMTTNCPTFEKSAEAMRRGASDILVKPFEPSEAEKVIVGVLARKREKLASRSSANGAGNLTEESRLAQLFYGSEYQAALVGQSRAMAQLFEKIARVAQGNWSVLITGATGTGKELVARALHERSRRAAGPFVDINCSAIPDTLLEAELFGYQKGAFTGAHDTRRGMFETASGGTFFLDEVDALSPSAQAKLLRVLQEHQLRRLGGRENIRVDLRIISATNRDLLSAAAEGTFRTDLLYRLRIVPLHVPELRQRREDIPFLINRFLKKFKLTHGGVPKRFTAEALRALTDYSWPGNVRELENAVEYACAISSGQDLDFSDLPPEISMAGEDVSNMMNKYMLDEASLAEVERYYILNMFKRCGKHHIRTASILGVDRRTLYRKLQQYGVKFSDQESSSQTDREAPRRITRV